jgi:predicted aspartyl protease
MRGLVDDSGRAILPIEILCPKYPTGVRVDAWIDTGFTGDLVLPQSLIDDLQLEITGSIDLRDVTQKSMLLPRILRIHSWVHIVT